MIKDTLANSTNYYKISERLKLGFEWLRNTDLVNISDGKHILDNDNVFANVQTYVTKDSAPFEAHRKYIDIQYMIKGSENVGVTDYSNCTVTKEYDTKNDVEFLECSNNEYVKLEEGQFVVFFPQDAHAPSQKISENKSVKKVIVKVLI